MGGELSVPQFGGSSVTAKTAAAYEGCKHWQPSNPLKRDNRQHRRRRLLAVGGVGLGLWPKRCYVIGRGQSSPMSYTLTMLQGLRSLLVWQGSARKLRKTGHRREANLEMLIQVDHQARQGAGWSLKRFQAVDSDKVIALSKRPTWHVCLDQAFVGWCFIWYAFHFLKLRGAISPDPVHRVTNNMKLADNASNLNVLQLEYATVLSLRVGPFGKHQHHKVIKQATQEFLKEVDGDTSTNPGKTPDNTRWVRFGHIARAMERSGHLRVWGANNLGSAIIQ